MRPRWHDFQQVADTLGDLCQGYPGKAAHDNQGYRVWDLVADCVIEQHEDINVFLVMDKNVAFELKMRFG